MLLNRLLRSVLIRIHRFPRYKYKSFADPGGKILLSSSEDNSFFDPCAIPFGDAVYVVCSDRKNDSIVCFDMEKPIEMRTLLRPEKNRWDEKVNRACVVKVGDEYYMWFTGQKGDESKIGLAVSSDGLCFKKVGSEPVLVPSLPEEKKSVMNPSVIFDYDSKLFKMWYSGGDCYEPDCIFYAESRDGTVWFKAEKPVLRRGNEKYDRYKVGGCDVVKTKNGHYIMHYIGYQNIDLARVCVASSDDGISWNKSNKNPIVCPSKNGWDADSCYKPSYIYDSKKNKRIILYNGRKGNLERIGYVVVGDDYEDEI